jgi:dihydrofolate synthase/folylpolyglutamate synthase
MQVMTDQTLNTRPLQTLSDWLAHCEALHPTAMDFGLDRIRTVASRMNAGAGLKVGMSAGGVPLFTVAGTNGKGSTCAMLESVLLASGFRVATHTSPHLVRFEERLRINGQPVQAQALLPHFAAVESARRAGSEVSLSYFEFTLLAMLDHVQTLSLDALILEVGLGGRLDATNLFDTDCAVITSIDLDHMEYLGPDREAIGREKVQIARPGKPCVVSDPLPPASVVEHANAIGADLWLHGRDFNQSGDKQQWNWAGRARRYAGLGYPALRGANQLVNASGVLAALTAMREHLPVTAQGVRVGLSQVELPGRFQIVPGQPTLVLDVAHNPHSVAALAENLDAMGFFPTTHAVFGAMADKDLPAMLKRVAPLIDVWHCTDLPTPRAAKATELIAKIQDSVLGTGRKDVKTSAHESASAALAHALAAAGSADRIVVFGSFLTVGGVLEAGLPKLAAAHVATPASNMPIQHQK